MFLENFFANPHGQEKMWHGNTFCANNFGNKAKKHKTREILVTQNFSVIYSITLCLLSLHLNYNGPHSFHPCNDHLVFLHVFCCINPFSDLFGVVLYFDDRVCFIPLCEDMLVNILILE